MNSVKLMQPALPAVRAAWARSCGAAVLAVACLVPGMAAHAEALPVAPAADAKPAEKPADKPAEAPADVPKLPELKLDVPADVHSITTVGRWTDKKLSGSYRVIVVRSGGDILLTRVVVQWVREKTGEPPSIVASREVEAFAAYAGNALVPSWRELEHTRLQLVGDVRLVDGQRKRVRVLATTPGEFTDPI